MHGRHISQISRRWDKRGALRQRAGGCGRPRKRRDDLDTWRWSNWRMTAKIGWTKGRHLPRSGTQQANFLYKELALTCYFVCVSKTLHLTFWGLFWKILKHMSNHFELYNMKTTLKSYMQTFSPLGVDFRKIPLRVVLP